MKSKAHLLKRAIWLKSLFLTACLLLATIPAFSQTKTVTGTVTDAAGDALIGVSILVQGSNNGVVTDLDGKYTLNNVPENATLIISYIGMLTQEVKVNGQSVVNVTLKEDSQQLEEVVVIGYGAAKAKDLTAPITVVKGEALTTVPSTTPMAALQGKVPGVNIVNNGAPGEGPTVQIRGIGSFSNSKPLFVVDGMFYDNINFLKCIISDQISCDLPCKTHKRNTVIVGCRNSGNKIRRPGTACHKTDTYLSGRSCIGIRRMHKRLLVSWQNHSCIVLLIKLIADINRTGAWISEQNIHPFFF